MPYSSSAFTSEASEKRGGGSVKCWSVWMRSSGTRSPGFIAGNLRPSSSSSEVLLSLPSSYTARKPGSMMVVPLARNTVLAAGGQIHADGVEGGRHHLAGDGALPDQFVQAAAVVVEILRHLRRRAQRGGRADRFVRFLRVLGLGLVDVGLVRHRLGAEIARDHVADLAQRFGRQADRVGTHVADQADRAFVADRHAFVQLLRHAAWCGWW